MMQRIAAALESIAARLGEIAADVAAMREGQDRALARSQEDAHSAPARMMEIVARVQELMGGRQHGD
jgi:hypothetical protein